MPSSGLFFPGENVDLSLSVATDQFSRSVRVHLQVHNRSSTHKHAHLEDSGRNKASDKKATERLKTKAAE